MPISNALNKSDQSLLLKFNNRDRVAFAEVYSQLFNGLYYYARKLFAGTSIEPEDLVQELFVNLWLKEKDDFISMDHIKNYMYLSVRNKQKDFITHKKYIDDYESEVRKDEDFHVTTIIESEVLSALEQALTVLPSECAKVFKLHVEGWSVKDIALKLNKSESTVYHQKDTAIEILKKKLDSGAFLLLINFF